MIQEQRRLTFNQESLRHVFRWYATVPNQRDLPMGVVTDVVVHETAPVGVTVLIQQSGAMRLREIALASDRLMVALICFCRQQRIPLPKNPHKTLSSLDGAIVLDLELTLIPVAVDLFHTGSSPPKPSPARVAPPLHKC